MEEKPQQETTQIEATPEEVAPITPKAPEEAKKRWIKPLIFSILGLLVAASLVFGGYKLAQIRQVQPQPTPTPVVVPTPTSEPTADWKIYTNTKYGYSIKYPASWFINFDSSGNQQFSDIESESPFDTRVRVDVNPVRREYFDQKYNSGVGTKWEAEFEVTEEKIVNLSVAGEPAVKLIRTPSEGATSPAYIVRILVAKDSDVFEISSWGKSKEDQQKYDTTFNLMLSTFRFLEESDEAQIREVLDEYIPEHSLVKVFELEGLKILGNFAKVTIVPKDIVTDKAFVILEKGEGQWSVIWGPGTAIGKTDPVLEKIPEELLR